MPIISADEIEALLVRFLQLSNRDSGQVGGAAVYGVDRAHDGTGVGRIVMPSLRRESAHRVLTDHALLLKSAPAQRRCGPRRRLACAIDR